LRARSGEGPFFVQLNTYRYHGHHVGDINREYYRKTERDPIINFGKWLTAEKIATEGELAAIDSSVRAEAEAAVAYALAAAYPDAAEVRMHVYAENAA
jgi:acetoin:2,6-dichlorophenolindophenol oxidoreductase subunit alpha